MNGKNDDFLSQQMAQESMTDDTSSSMDSADYSNYNNNYSAQTPNAFSQQNQNSNGMNSNANQAQYSNQNYTQNNGFQNQSFNGINGNTNQAQYSNQNYAQNNGFQNQNFNGMNGNTNGFVPNQQNMNFQNQYGQNPVRFMCSSKTTTKKFRILPVIFVCIFVIIGAFLIFTSYSNKKAIDNLVKECTSQCYATVTDVTSYSKRVKRNKHYTTQTYYTPTYTYTVSGKNYVDKSSYNSSSSSAYYVGMKALIHYNPSNPSKYYPDGVSLSKNYVVTMMTGILLTMIGLIFIASLIKQRKKFA